MCFSTIVYCYQEVRYLNELIKDMYDCFYALSELPVQKQEVEEYYHTFSEIK